MNPQFVSAEDIKKKYKNGIVLDEPDYEGDINVNTLPDTEKLLDTVLEILEFMALPENLAVKKINNDEYEKIIERKYSEFADTYFNLFRMLLSGNDLEPLFIMFESINKMKAGQSNVREEEEKVDGYLMKFLPDELLDENVKKKYKYKNKK